MSATVAPPAMSRTTPTNTPRPPIRWLPAVSAASSAPRSKSCSCTRTAIVSAPGDRWEERDLVACRHRMVRLDIVLVDRASDGAGVAERLRLAGPAAAQPVDQPGHGGHALGRVDGFLSDADQLRHARAVQELHGLPSLSATHAERA